jgi:hypothetical protein
LPYSPEKVSPIVKVENILNSSIKVYITNQDEEKTIALKE